MKSETEEGNLNQGDPHSMSTATTMARNPLPLITRVGPSPEPQQLRDSNRLRQMVANEFQQIQAAVGGMLIDRPQRNILRRQCSRGAA